MGVETILEHQPMWLQVEKKYRCKLIPFKFNLDWLKEQDFRDLVNNT